MGTPVSVFTELPTKNDFQTRVFTRLNAIKIDDATASLIFKNGVRIVREIVMAVIFRWPERKCFNNEHRNGPWRGMELFFPISTISYFDFQLFQREKEREIFHESQWNCCCWESICVPDLMTKIYYVKTSDGSDVIFPYR